MTCSNNNNNNSTMVMTNQNCVSLLSAFGLKGGLDGVRFAGVTASGHGRDIE